jgi:hypothetical protein
VEDVERLTSAIDYLLNEEQRRRGLAAEARRASLEHSLEDSLNAVVSVWEYALANYPRRR